MRTLPVIFLVMAIASGIIAFFDIFPGVVIAARIVSISSFALFLVSVLASRKRV